METQRVRKLLLSLCQAQCGAGWAWAGPQGKVPFGNNKGLTVGCSRAGGSFGAGSGDKPGREQEAPGLEAFKGDSLRASRAV